LTVFNFSPLRCPKPIASFAKEQAMSRRSRIRRELRGFTLIELLVVISIISVLIALL
jgi:prepilin-type N-terminal cleavage/methylation domain-containing protein